MEFKKVVTIVQENDLSDSVVAEYYGGKPLHEWLDIAVDNE
jgi:hypothetical protein